MNEDVPEAYFGLANVLAGRGQDAEAVRLYDRALRIRAEHVVRQYLLADPVQAYFERMRVGPQDAFERDVDCGS